VAAVSEVPPPHILNKNCRFSKSSCLFLEEKSIYARFYYQSIGKYLVYPFHEKGKYYFISMDVDCNLIMQFSEGAEATRFSDI
jgi:hypothetical protein